MKIHKIIPALAFFGMGVAVTAIYYSYQIRAFSESVAISNAMDVRGYRLAMKTGSLETYSALREQSNLIFAEGVLGKSKMLNISGLDEAAYHKMFDGVDNAGD